MFVRNSVTIQAYAYFSAKTLKLCLKDIEIEEGLKDEDSGFRSIQDVREEQRNDQKAVVFKIKNKTYEDQKRVQEAAESGALGKLFEPLADELRKAQLGFGTGKLLVVAEENVKSKGL